MTSSFGDVDRNWLRRFRRNLSAWYARHARDLPWRNTDDAYRVWISEIMLQQTTVTAVVPYFERFVKRFPTVHDLGAAAEQEVLQCWEGLGYYSRARNIHKTARLLSTECAGRFPDDVEELVKLPGIGRYTAGAIASFAFGRRAPIVEANTLRLYCRLLGFRGDPRASAGQRMLWDFAERVLPRQSPGRFNQALMELGATLCTPTEPNCPACPARSCCRAFAEGAQSEIPMPACRPEITAVTEASVAVRKDDTYLLHRRDEGERWAGLWDFPRFPVADQAVPARNSRRQRSAAGIPQTVSDDLKRTLQADIAGTTGVTAEIWDLLTEIHHSVTRYRIRLLCLSAEYRSGSLNGSRDSRWVHPDDFGGLPLSVTGRKLATLLVGLDSCPDD